MVCLDTRTACCAVYQGYRQRKSVKHKHLLIDICGLPAFLFPYQHKGKKVHAITCHEVTQGEQRFSSTLSLTLALVGGGWLTPGPGCFTPVNDAVSLV